MQDYLTIGKAGIGEYEEKRSRFIGSAIPVKTEQEAIAAPVEETTCVKEAVKTAPAATEEIEVEVEQVEVELSEEDDKEEA